MNIPYHSVLEPHIAEWHQHLSRATLQSLFIQSIPLVCTENEEMTPDLEYLMSVETSTRQAKEHFSRLKFNAIELQTKLAFLEAISDENLLLSIVSAPPDKTSIPKVQLKALKEKIEGTKADFIQQTGETFEAQRELDMLVQEKLHAIKDIVQLQEQVKQLESVSYPSQRYSSQEAKAILENQALMVQDLTRTIADQRDIVHEALLRVKREESLLEEYAREYTNSLEALKWKREEAIQRDAHLATLYHWYSEMTALIEGISGYKFDVGAEATQPLIVTILPAAGSQASQQFSLSIDETGLPTAISTDPQASLFWKKINLNACIARSREHSSLPLLFIELKKQMSALS